MFWDFQSIQTLNNDRVKRHVVCLFVCLFVCLNSWSVHYILSPYLFIYRIVVADGLIGPILNSPTLAILPFQSEVIVAKEGMHTSVIPCHYYYCDVLAIYVHIGWTTIINLVTGNLRVNLWKCKQVINWIIRNNEFEMRLLSIIFYCGNRFQRNYMFQAVGLSILLTWL